MKKTWYLLMVICAGFLYGCSETEELGDAEAGKTYFPLAIGDYRVYNVQFEEYLQGDTVTKQSFQLRERVDTLFNNLAGQLTYKIIRSKRANSSENWIDDSLITVTVTNDQLIHQSGNLSLVKMVFPVKENQYWSPNVYNNLDFDTLANGSAAPKLLRSHYTEVGQPFSVGNSYYPKTVKVVVNDEETFINIDKREEVYAEDIGLVYKKYNIINYCTQQPCGGIPDNYNFILTGYTRIETLESYGKL
jgi:hypothetical protein